MQSIFNDFKFEHFKNNKNSQSEIKLLIEEIILILEEWYLLNSSIKSRIELEYQIVFGDLEVELNKKKESIDFIVNELNKFKKTINNNEPKYFINNIQGNNNLYREIVKKIHPDVSKSKYRFLWDIVQLAYKKQDYEKLKTISIILNFENDNDFKDNNKFIMLKNQLYKHKKELNQQVNEEPFSFIRHLKEPEWIESRRFELKMKINNLDEKLNNKKQLLNTLTKLNLVS
jgi:hypothetical protein